MTELSYAHVVSPEFLKNFKEELWVDGEMVREAWCTELEQARPIIQDVVDNFPGYTFETLNSTKSNMIGYANNYRPPYNNGCISWYEWEYPTNQDLIQYNVTMHPGCTLYRWYGKKFDTTTKQVWLKYVIREVSRGVFPAPALPSNSTHAFFARIADEQGSTLSDIDVYFNNSWENVKQYCQDNNLVYPAPPGDEEAKTKLWAFVYNINTLQISKVKGYRIFNVDKR